MSYTKLLNEWFAILGYVAETIVVGYIHNLFYSAFFHSFKFLLSSVSAPLYFFHSKHHGEQWHN